MLGLKNHREFLDLLGKERVEQLKPTGNLFAPAVSFQLLTVQKLTNKEEFMKAVPSFKLTQEGSDIIVNTAIEKAKELKQIVSIAVVDAGGHLFAFKRMTNGRTHNTLLALAKAAWRGAYHGRHRQNQSAGAEIPDHQVLAQTLCGPGWFISIEGGIPITLEGQCIGAVGVSGAPPPWTGRSGRESMRLQSLALCIQPSLKIQLF